MRKKGKKYKHIISLKLAKYLDLALIFILLFDYLLYPLPAIVRADAGNNNYIIEKQVILMKILDVGAIDKTVFLNNSQEEENHLPVNSNIKEVKLSGNYTITAYNSKAGQTDNSPCITANGFDVCKNGVEDTVAANFLPFGAKVRIPDLFGDRVFVVRDRMHPRHKNRLDIWMINYEDAKQFGVKVAKIEVLE
ncbi:3D domain-containing protein [Patescibacteria group bacterium]|nr:3D domain-containing protein [Patescibacteria group bacterium]